MYLTIAIIFIATTLYIASSDDIESSELNCLFKNDQGTKCYNLHIFSTPMLNYTSAENYCSEKFNNSTLPSLLSPLEQLEIERNLEGGELFFWINIRGSIKYDSKRNKILFIDGQSNKTYNTSKWEMSDADLSIHSDNYYCVQAVGSDEDVFEGSGGHSDSIGLDTKYSVRTSITWTLKPCEDYAYNVLCEHNIDIATTTINPIKLTANYATGSTTESSTIKIDVKNNLAKTDSNTEDIPLETVLAIVKLSNNIGQVLFAISILILVIILIVCILSMIFCIYRKRGNYAPIIRPDIGFPLVFVNPKYSNSANVTNDAYYMTGN